MASPADRQVLIKLRDAARGLLWPASVHWDPSADVRCWKGVQLDASGRVEELHIDFSNEMASTADKDEPGHQRTGDASHLYCSRVEMSRADSHDGVVS